MGSATDNGANRQMRLPALPQPLGNMSAANGLCSRITAMAPSVNSWLMSPATDLIMPPLALGSPARRFMLGPLRSDAGNEPGAVATTAHDDAELPTTAAGLRRHQLQLCACMGFGLRLGVG